MFHAEGRKRRRTENFPKKDDYVFDARVLYATYFQNPYTPSELLDMFRTESKNDGEKWKWAVVCQKTHKTTGPWGSAKYLKVLVMFENPRIIRDARNKWGIRKPDGTYYHFSTLYVPEEGYALNRALSYLRSEGNVLEDGDVPVQPELSSGYEWNTSQPVDDYDSAQSQDLRDDSSIDNRISTLGSDKWFLGALQAPTVKDGMDYLKRNLPREWFKWNITWERSLRLHMNEKMKPHHDVPANFTPFVYPKEVLEWKREEWSKSLRPKCLILHGKTRLGKTEMILSLFPTALHIQGALSRDSLTRSAVGGYSTIVYEDLNWDDIDTDNVKALLSKKGYRHCFDDYYDIDVTWSSVVLFNTLEYPRVFKEEYWKDNAVFLEIKERLY
jgi:hypothetical protein